MDKGFVAEIKLSTIKNQDVIQEKRLQKLKNYDLALLI